MIYQEFSHQSKKRWWLDLTDLISILDRAETVSNGDSRATNGCPVQRFLNYSLASAVEGRGRLIEQQDRPVPNNCACQSDALSLSTTQKHASFANDGIVSICQGRDKVVRVSDFGRLVDELTLFLFRRRFVFRTNEAVLQGNMSGTGYACRGMYAYRNVFVNARAEKDRLLTDKANLRAQV